MPELLFHGAAGEVTGSMHLVRVDSRWVALDCGLHHGRRAETEAKNRAWPVPPKDIAAVVLSHAHIDHSGRLPRLVRDGFDGPIFATPATRDLCAIMLPDSAHIQEEDAFYINKRRARKGLPPVEILYGYEEALATIRLIQSVPYDRWFQVTDGLLARFHEAGHMLGSAGIELACGKRNGHAPSLFYTGDLGRRNKPIIRDPAPIPPCDAIICESTYGNRFHDGVGNARQALGEIVNRTVERRGKVIIPAFSVGRTQTIVYFLHELMLTKEIPRIPVFVDSPLSVNATEVFRMHPECYDAEARALQRVTSDILGGSCCTYIRDVEESKALHRRRAPCVIISASGMCETGRIQHHIKNNIGHRRNTLLFPGFQAAHTLGRKIADGARKITLFHEEHHVRAEVVQLHGFSGHADQYELRAQLGVVREHAQRVFLVHGEAEQSKALADELRNDGFARVDIVQPGERAEL
jgi:metallo-beta-lactamase family protein